MDTQRNFLEDLNKKGLLGKGDVLTSTSGASKANLFSGTATLPFGDLTTSSIKSLSAVECELPHGETFDGFDVDILSSSKLKKIDNTNLQLEVKIARLRAELEEHKKLVESSFLKSDKAHYQKLIEIQKRMETEIQRLVAVYQNQQLKSIVFSPFAKLFNYIKSYIALK